jgi:two-component system phosphate regulon response regulator PhoB
MMDAHILVIDDAPDLRALYADAFEGEGYRVTLMAHVPADPEEIDAIQPDVIVVDYLFDGQPVGWHLVHALKQRPTTQHLPILLCTAAARTVQEHLPYLHAQQIGLLLKPFELDALLRGIQELLGGTRDDGETVFVQAAARSVA